MTSVISVDSWQETISLLRSPANARRVERRRAFPVHRPDQEPDTPAHPARPTMTASGPWLTEASATRDVEPVAPNMLAAGERINNSHRHVRPPRLLADDDGTLGISACHDAIRKAITAHMEAAGVQPRRRPSDRHRLRPEPSHGRHRRPGLGGDRRYPPGSKPRRARRLRCSPPEPATRPGRG